MRFAPFDWRSDVRCGLRAGVGTATAFQAADRADLHVAIAGHLTRQPDADGPLRHHPLPLGDGHSRRLSLDELDTAGGAPRVAAARVQDVDMCVLLDRKHQPLAALDIERSESLNRQLWHVQSPSL